LNFIGTHGENAGLRVAKADEAVAEVYRHVVRDLHAGAGMERPCQAPLVTGRGKALPSGDHVVVKKVRDGVVRHADARTDVWPDVVPRAEVVVGVREKQQFALLRGVVVGGAVSGGREGTIGGEVAADRIAVVLVERAEGRVAAILPCQIDTKVVTKLIA
jgi:hypothetical protein